MSSAELNLLTKVSGPNSGNHPYTLLCEFAKDSPSVAGNRKPECVYDLLGDPEQHLERAYRLARRFIAAEPEIEGVRMLEIWEEQLIQELELLFRDLHLHRWIETNRYAVCRTSVDWAARLLAIQSEEPGYRTIASGSDTSSLRHKIRDHFRDHGISVRGLQVLWKRGFRRLFPILSSSRQASGSHLSTAPGERWFYSTSYNYSNIGLAYETYLNHPFHFVYEDEETGGRKLVESGRKGHSIYSYATSRDLPKRRYVTATGDRIRVAIENVSCSDPDEIKVRQVFLGGAFNFFLKRILPLALYHTRVARNFLNVAQPGLVVVGNAAWERPLLIQARKQGIPTVMLQHGVVHRNYRLADQPVDIFFVRGQFFYQQLCPELQCKARLLNLPAAQKSTLADPPGRDLLFVTVPHDLLPLIHEWDLEDVLSVLVHVAANERRRLVIRVHPMESVALYRRRIERLAERTGIMPEVVYSQGPGIQQVLESSGVAVLYYSTVFLDCLRLGIPIVSFDWHEFPFKRHYKAEGVFQFASDLKDLERLTQLGLRGELPPTPARYELFQHPTRPEEIQDSFDRVARK